MTRTLVVPSPYMTTQTASPRYYFTAGLAGITISLEPKRRQRFLHWLSGIKACQVLPGP